MHLSDNGREQRECGSVTIICSHTSLLFCVALDPSPTIQNDSTTLYRKDTFLKRHSSITILIGCSFVFMALHCNQHLKQPMLILQGERDYQVTMEDFAGWKKNLSSKASVEFKTYPNLNHLFMEGEGKSTPHEYETAGHVAEIVINDIADWMKTR